MDTISESNTTFEERLVARLAQMGEHDVTVTVPPEQKERNAAAARARYALRTDAEKDADRERKKAEACARAASRTDAQKDAIKVRDRARYALRTEEIIEHDKVRHREWYHRTHPHSRLNKENERIAANKRIEDAVKKANLTAGEK